jgi:hypothetical protein
MNENLRKPLYIHFDGPLLSDHRMSIDSFIQMIKQVQVAVHRIGANLSDSSYTRGRRPKDLKESCSLELVAFKQGSFDVVCDLPPKQLQIADDLGEQSLDCLFDGLVALKADTKLPRGFDKGVLMALREGSSVFDRGVTEIQFGLGLNGSAKQTIFDVSTRDNLVRRIQIPVMDRETLDGVLTMGDFRSNVCRLHVDSGPPVKCVFDKEQQDAILAALKCRVTISGVAMRVGCEIKQLQIDDIAINDESPEFDLHPFFDNITNLDALAEEQGVPSVVPFRSLLGDFWPNDESADEFLSTVRALRD